MCSLQDKSCKINEEATSNQKWLTCSANRQQHEPDKLKITQIIPSDGKSLQVRKVVVELFVCIN